MMGLVVCGLFCAFVGVIGCGYWTILAAAFLPPSDLERSTVQEYGTRPLHGLGEAARDDDVVRCQGTVVAIDPLTVADSTGSAIIQAPFQVIANGGWLTRRRLRVKQRVEVVGRLREAALAVGYREDAKPHKVIAAAADSVFVIKGSCVEYDAAWQRLQTRQYILRYVLFAPFILAVLALIVCLVLVACSCPIR